MTALTISRVNGIMFFVMIGVVVLTLAALGGAIILPPDLSAFVVGVIFGIHIYFLYKGWRNGRA